MNEPVDELRMAGFLRCIAEAIRRNDAETLDHIAGQLERKVMLATPADSEEGK